MTENFIVTGMTCSACSARVEKSVQKLPGTSNVAVNLMSGRLHVDFDEALCSVDDIFAAVQSDGYGISLASSAAVSAQRKEQDAVLTSMRRRLTVSLSFLIPLFYLSMGHMMSWPLPHIFHANIYLTAAVQIALLLPILIANRAYFTVGFSRLIKLAQNMDTLVALGAAAGIVYSLLVLVGVFGPIGDMPELYFEGAGMILTLVTVGKFLEQRSRGKTAGAVSALVALAPDSAVVLRDGKERTVPVAEVQVGDTVIVRQGGKIPVDGIVLRGEAAVDESAITGESVPAEKCAGERVTAATVSRSGYLEIEALRVGEDTTLSQIIRLMEEAGSTKAPIARLADRVSGIFVPAVIAIALLSALCWYFLGHQSVGFSLSIGIAVLVISCPCALGLATPVAIMVGTGKAAEQGVLIKSAESLETLHKIDTVVLDKTGTVTEAEPTLAGIYPAAGIGENELLSLAAALEALSEHPLARAIVSAARSRGIAPQTAEQFSATAGGGVEALLSGKRVLGGNERMMNSRGISLEAMRETAQLLAQEGKTPLYFAREDALLGILALAAPIKESSFEAAEEFRALGAELVLLTGDNRRTADAIGRELGITRVLAEVLPQDKEKCVADLQREGKKVAMVGDGINDAPALARADVGIAIGAGTDVAIESADVVLIKSDLRDAAAAMRLSSAVVRNIKQNLFWAFLYNTIGIPIAAGLLYLPFAFRLNPMFAAAAMSMSSVCVVTNALRLRSFQMQRSKNKESAPTGGKETKMNTVTMKIEGMMCMHCTGRVDAALNALEGITATVSLEGGTATVSSENAIDTALLRETVEKAGYKVLSVD
ncbi:MAG: heavy metal translocating P-type ATPase [Oscillospiraceae bacterium]|nr:heavy metal translocating P-type ATPase [Oscillospiraceae bacterium]